MGHLYSVHIRFSPNIYRDEHLNNAAAMAGSIERVILGHTKDELFQNIREKIWALSSEAVIIDNNVMADEYNRWIVKNWKRKSVPTEINNVFDRDMRYALPIPRRSGSGCVHTEYNIIR